MSLSGAMKNHQIINRGRSSNVTVSVCEYASLAALVSVLKAKEQ
jgi:hypothetical protein